MKNTFLNTQRLKSAPNYWDAIALLFILSVVVVFAWASMQMSKPYHLGQLTPIYLNPSYLPYYALSTVWRMIIAMFFSVLFTFTVATWAAKSQYAGRVIIPLIDILQSIPVLSFLSITVVGFIELFPGSWLGPEAAVIFVLFTAQAWNMALGFYQSLRTVPADMLEAADMFQLSAWQKFWRIEVPFAMPSLLWNSMMSMSASWFFLVFSEAVTVSNQTITLPGVGSYIAVAISHAYSKGVVFSILTMLVVIIIYDQILFRPLIAWGEKFKTEQTPAETQAESWVINLFNRTRWLANVIAAMGKFFDGVVNFSLFRRRRSRFSKQDSFAHSNQFFNLFFNSALAIIIIISACILAHFIYHTVSFSDTWHVVLLGFYTGLRVLACMVFCTVFWVPIGVWVGLRPRLASRAQALIQFLASFPANLLFPVVVVAIVYFHLNVNVWTTPLMLLGTQWYVLFNVIAGASTLPKDLLQAADNFSVTGFLRWRKVVFPAIFPFYITGAISAAGGAWNASLAAEVISWGNTHLVASGLGAYITQFTNSGDFPRVALGTGVMCIFVLVLNRILWRPLYLYAERHFKLG